MAHDPAPRHDAAGPSRPERRVVLLGASNLTRGISTVLESAWNACGQPLDVLLAHGHGRSYGQASRVLGRQLPSVLESGLWPALADRPPLPTFALITDIGNDLLYGVPVPRVVEWVGECVSRLEAVGARIAMTRLPLCAVATLSERRFLFFRRLFVPSCRLELDELRGHACELDAQLAQFADRGVRLVEQRADWYGLDPIHITMRSWPRAWREVLAGWSDVPAPLEPARGSLPRWLRLRLLVPQERVMLGFRQRRVQPCLRLSDGTHLSVY